VKPVEAAKAGFVRRIDAYAIGVASVILGAGRSKKEDAALPGVGIVLERKAGDPVSRGDVLCRVHAESEDKAAEACALAGSAFQLGETRLSPAPLIIEEITTA
jgi:thymidine phosphorylase